MALSPRSRVNKVRGISSSDEKAIKDYLQGAVRAWVVVESNRGKQFAARDLVGGPNHDWRGTPPEALYQKHSSRGKTHKEAIKAAGRDLGWLLKAVLDEDKKRNYKVGRAGRVNGYTWF